MVASLPAERAILPPKDIKSPALPNPIAKSFDVVPALYNCPGTEFKSDLYLATPPNTSAISSALLTPQLANLVNLGASLAPAVAKDVPPVAQAQMPSETKAEAVNDKPPKNLSAKKLAVSPTICCPKFIF